MDKTVILSFIVACLGSLVVTSCVGGVYDGVTPYPYPLGGNYATPPIVSWPDFNILYKGNSSHISSSKLKTMKAKAIKHSNPNLKIAYQSSVDDRVENLVGLLTVDLPDGYSICSATPIKYDATNDQTVFITAAHCLMAQKNDPNSLNTTDIYSVQDMYISQGIKGWSDPVNVFAVEAVYLPSRYCYGSVFAIDGEGVSSCPNLKYKAGTEGNDIAIVVVSGKFSNPDNYPQITKLQNYPITYTKAPILSIGYGVVNGANSSETWPDQGIQAFAVTNYSYAETNQAGYHYLLNSIFNEDHKAYATLVCSGDSGGPDLFWDQNLADSQDKGKWILLSEHTYGPAGECGSFYKNLYVHGNGSTNVGYYYDWITGILGALNNSSYCNNPENKCVLQNQ